MAVVKAQLGRVFVIIRLIQRWFQHHPETSRWLNVARLGLFQFGMGLSLAPITGTLNRVLIDELSIPAVAVGFLIAIHYFVSPTRALIGFRSDQDRARGSWRTPYLVFGAMLTYGGLATAPFSLILLSGEGVLPFWMAITVCALIFLAYGIGVNIVETIYLALVSDITPPKERGRVLAILWMALVLGTIVGSVIIGRLLFDYSHMRLIQVMQGSAVTFIALTAIALFNQEKLQNNGMVQGHDTAEVRVRDTLLGSLRVLAGQRMLRNLFVVLFIATLGFATHDVLLEPYGGQVLQMSVAATTQLTAFWGVAMLVSIAGAGWLIWKGRSSVLLIGMGCVCGALGFLVVSLANNPSLVNEFRAGIWLIGMGRGLFIVGSLVLVMSLVDVDHAGLFLGLWGIMQALAQGFGTIGAGLVRDIAQATTGSVVTGYTIVYSFSMSFLLLSLLLIVAMRLNRQVKTGAMRSPWSGLQEINNADQIMF